MELVNVGSGNLVSVQKIVAILVPDSAPVKRIVQDAKENGAAIDATQGKKTKSVIVTESGHVIMSSLSSEIIHGRILSQNEEEPKFEK